MSTHTEVRLVIDEELEALIRLALELRPMPQMEEHLKGLRAIISMLIEEQFEEMPF